MRHGSSTLSFLILSGTSAGDSQCLRVSRIAGITPLEVEDQFRDAASLTYLVPWLEIAGGEAQLEPSAQVLTCGVPAAQPQSHHTSWGWEVGILSL